MKTTKRLMLTGMVAAIAVTVVSNAQAGGAKRQGTSILHYMTRNSLVTTEAGSNVTGSLRLEYHAQGGSSKQSLRLKAGGLETNAAYTLIAMVDDDTNAVPVDSFATRASGKASIDYQARSKEKGHGRQKALPDPLNPLTDVQSIGIENSLTQTVAYAWIADAEKFQYLVKRNLIPEDTNSTASGSITLIANPRKVRFQLRAAGLDATNDYQLALNSEIFGTVTADAKGRVAINAWPINAPGVLDLRSLALLDAGSNTVLSTTLPLDPRSPSGPNRGGHSHSVSHSHSDSHSRSSSDAFQRDDRHRGKEQD